MKTIIRLYTDSDETAVVELWRRCGLVVPQNDPYVDIRKKVEFQPELFFVAVTAKEIVGSIMAGYEGHRGWINYLGVDPRCRNQGIGSSLVRHAVEELEKIGCQKVNLQVRTANTGVIAFYKTLGFAEDEAVSLGYRIKATQ